MTRRDRAQHERILRTADSVTRAEWNRMQSAQDKLAAFEVKVKAYATGPTGQGGTHV